MALRNPVAVYNAATNVEAHVVKLILNEAGIEAHVADDVSVVGLWPFGTLPEIHKPQVWIDHADLERAEPVLAAYQEDQIQRARAAPGAAAAADAPIAVVCEDCGQSSSFPASDRGRIRQCPHCGGYVDVEEAAPDDACSDDAADEYWLGEEDDD